MGLPKVTFNIADNGLGRVGDGVQKTPGLIVSGVTSPEISVGESKQIFSLDDATALGITEGTNAVAYKHIKGFYDEAGAGAELWIMLVSPATTYEQMADVNENIAKKLISDAGGNIRILGLVKSSTGTETIAEGLDADVKQGVIKLQELGDYYAERYMPFRGLISGNNFSGTPADLFDYATGTWPRVNMLIANNDGAPEASIGQELGRLAAIPTQRSIARVKDGEVETEQCYFTDGSPVESLYSAWNSIHDKGYTFYRNFPGRVGYYFTDDKTLVDPTNDFSTLSRGLVMDEAVIIANDVLTEELSSEVPVTEDGKIHPAIIKSWQSNIETRIGSLMVGADKLSGVEAFIDENQNVLATDKVIVNIRLQPVGYAKFIEVNIGFTTNIA